MKKIITVMLALITALSICCIPGSAAYDGISDIYTAEVEGGTFILLEFSSSFVKFADDFSITIKSEEKSLTFTKEQLKCGFEEESYAEPRIGIVSYVEPVICFPVVDMNDFSVVIPENVVFTEDGNGNSASEKSDFESFNLSLTSSNTTFPLYEKDEITAKTSCLADYYLDDELIAENVESATFPPITAGEHKITVRKYGIIIWENTISCPKITFKDKTEKIFGLYGEAFEGFLFGFIFLLSPILYCCFPPLGAAAIAAPIVSIASVIAAFKGTFEILAM